MLQVEASAALLEDWRVDVHSVGSRLRHLWVGGRVVLLLCALGSVLCRRWMTSWVVVSAGRSLLSLRLGMWQLAYQGGAGCRAGAALRRWGRSLLGRGWDWGAAASCFHQASAMIPSILKKLSPCRERGGLQCEPNGPTNQRLV